MTAKARPAESPADLPTGVGTSAGRSRRPHTPLDLVPNERAGVLVTVGAAAVEADEPALRLHGFPPQAGPEILAPVTGYLNASAELKALVASDGEPATRDYAWPQEGPRSVWIRACSLPTLHDGRPARRIWLFDITAEKLRDLEIERSRDRMAQAQGFTHVGNWEWNLKSGICRWSDELYRIYGQDPATFQPTPYNEPCLHPADVEQVRETLERCIDRHEATTFEFRIRRPSGEERVIEVHVDVVLDESGAAVALTGATNDVTRDKVIQHQLQEETRKAERANRAKSEFMANMSHELRTPLNAIIGFSEVMRREMFGGLGDERYRDYAASILESGNHLLGLINDILDLAKVEAGKYRLREEVVDVTGVIDHCLNTFTVALERKDLTLLRDVPDDLPRLSADKRVLQQILLNVLSNAVKFTQKGSVTIDAGCQGHDKGDFLIRITDTGVGMAPKDIARAFEPFEQIESTAALSHEGTGIGLSLTKRLLEAHGGSLRLTSELGVGTTVEARFPESRIVR